MADPCACIKAVGPADLACNFVTAQTEVTACDAKCKDAWKACSMALKDAAPLVDACECGCSMMTTMAPSGRYIRQSLKNMLAN